MFLFFCVRWHMCAGNPLMLPRNALPDVIAKDFKDKIPARCEIEIFLCCSILVECASGVWCNNFSSSHAFKHAHKNFKARWHFSSFFPFISSFSLFFSRFCLQQHLYLRPVSHHVLHTGVHFTCFTRHRCSLYYTQVYTLLALLQILTPERRRSSSTAMMCVLRCANTAASPLVFFSFALHPPLSPSLRSSPLSVDCYTIEHRRRT